MSIYEIRVQHKRVHQVSTSWQWRAPPTQRLANDGPWHTFESRSCRILLNEKELDAFSHTLASGIKIRDHSKVRKTKQTIKLRKLLAEFEECDLLFDAMCLETRFENERASSIVIVGVPPLRMSIRLATWAFRSSWTPPTRCCSSGTPRGRPQPPGGSHDQRQRRPCVRRPSWSSAAAEG